MSQHVDVDSLDIPGYVRLHQTGELHARAQQSFELLRSCSLCPRNCGVDRLAGERGYCQAGSAVKVSRFIIHIGEEPPISGTCGSGTIFFSHCNLRCLICQNEQISLDGDGQMMAPVDLAQGMLELQNKGVHNINLVTPSHFLPWILEALCIASDAGLRLPVVYNSGGYENLESLYLLDGVVDIYLPDAKYSDGDLAKTISNAPDYPEVNAVSLREMFRQSGHLQMDDRGIAKKGLIIRHLVLPGYIDNSKGVLQMIARTIGTGASISLMSQYFATNRVQHIDGLNRAVSPEEYRACVTTLLDMGFDDGWVQEELGVPIDDRPDFDRHESVMK